MVTVGITGSIGSGKTTVARMFARCGAIVWDADLIAHAALKKASASYKKIVRAFGRKILLAEGTISRPRLAENAFRDRRSQKKLCSIIHPFVFKEIRARMRRLRRRNANAVVVVEAALLIESGFYREFDRVIVVKATAEQGIARVCGKGTLRASQVRKRLAFQLPLRKKIAYADFIIDNRGTRSRTNSQVTAIWRRLKSYVGKKSKR